MIDEDTLLLIDAIEKISRTMKPGNWSRKNHNRLTQAMALLMQVTGELENVEIGPVPADVWKKVTL